MSLKKNSVKTPKAPAPIGPYNQAIQVGNFVFCSGQLGMHPETGALEGSVEQQARRAIENIQAILIAAGSHLDQIVKTTIFLKNMGDFTKVNEVYGEFFKNTPPARSTIEVARLPKDALVEIEVTAFVN